MSGRETRTPKNRELSKLAAASPSRERADHSLQPTALVNEAYVKFADLNRLRWQDRTHCFGVAALLMRQELVDHVRARRAEKRGRGVPVVPISEALALDRGEGSPSDVLAIHEALEALERNDQRAATVVECRFFVGLSI